MTDGSGEPEVVLVITAPDDSTADAVEIELTKRACSVVRFDTGDFPTRIRMAVRNDSTRWRGKLVIGSDAVDLDAVKAVYYRRPSRFVLPEGLSAGDAAFAITEARLGFGGPFSSLPVLWVNHPAKVAMAEYKSAQLTTAAAVGLSVPRTLITNARVTMVGPEPFAVAIHAASERARVDWRADYRSLRYERIEPPPEVVDGARRYLTTFGLNYGAFDFVIEPSGAWRFLECNPNGQWLWLEHEAGLPIAAALADLLSGGVSPW
ncbi:MAG: MvdC/MvdD family ATP grasp protein [Pseudonocardiaceae bacterium]